LSRYDEAYQRKFGVRAPIKGSRDAALAKQLLEKYSLEDLGDWLEVFFRHPDPWIQGSGHGFNIFSSQISKCITAKPKVKPPPAPVVELAKSIARKNAEEAELGSAWLRLREFELMAQGLNQPQAVMQASQEWLKRS
jgi:hypothetical protein